jgi:hypothetical protein
LGSLFDCNRSGAIRHEWSGLPFVHDIVTAASDKLILARSDESGVAVRFELPLALPA